MPELEASPVLHQSLLVSSERYMTGSVSSEKQVDSKSVATSRSPSTGQIATDAKTQGSQGSWHLYLNFVVQKWRSDSGFAPSLHRGPVNRYLHVGW